MNTVIIGDEYRPKNVKRPALPSMLAEGVHPIVNYELKTMKRSTD